MFFHRKRAGREREWFDLGCKLFEQEKFHEAEVLFRQSAQGREKALGKEHVDTLESKSKLACALYNQRKYGDVEELLRQLVQERVVVLGKEHIDTLASKQLLARALHAQRKNPEAEELSRQLVQEQERVVVLGKEHIDTLVSKNLLARTLRAQRKYSEAEELFQQTLRERVRVLGNGHLHTLDSKHSLGITLCNQHKYHDAEELFRQSVQGREKVLGKENVDTLWSKYWLALALRPQQKYHEAEKLFQQVTEGLERVRGKDHADTLLIKHDMACLFYKQQKYREAEELFRQAAQGREKTVGMENAETLDSKYWLAVTLFLQEKYLEAEELLRQTAEVQDKLLGKEHINTIASKQLLQELLLVVPPRTSPNGITKSAPKSPPTPITPPVSTNGTTKSAPSRLSDFFVEDKESRAPYTDSEIYEISSLLKFLNPRWSTVPRMYIILRTIGCLSLLDNFIDLGLSDHWFPVTERTLPHCLHPSNRSEFVRAQDLVLTKSMDLEKGEEGQHRYFRRNEPLPFETKEILGTGGFSKVEKVLSLISCREYARKLVPRNTVFGGRRMEDVKRFIAEIEILKRLKHPHVVEFVGSYTDPKYMGLVMSPVAEMDMTTYLRRADVSKHQELRSFFGCLARALEYLHGQNVRHKDIKPGNILVNRGNVLFTDFGLSFDFTDSDGSTTVSMVNGMTPKYCAPEVAMQEPRNTSSDIWSLGVVFMEMVVVLKGWTVEDMYKFFKMHGSQQAYVRTNPTALDELVAQLKETGSLSDNRVLGWAQQMLVTEQQLRPTASSLVASIIAVGNEGTTFCGDCCFSLDDDDFSDVADELEEDGVC